MNTFYTDDNDDDDLDEVEIDLSNFASSIYSVTLISENAVAVKKVTIAK